MGLRPGYTHLVRKRPKRKAGSLSGEENEMIIQN
jgi:hypothetical protein